MITLEEQLQHLARLQALMDKSSETNRAILVADEAEKIEQQLSSFSRYPEIELRWLNFHLKNFEVDDSGKAAYEEREAKIEHEGYALFALRCEDCIKKFVDEHKQQIKEKAELNKLIKDQQQSIFSQCLTKATQNYLHRYKSNPGKPFSTQDILSQAMAIYQQKMYKEALIEFEVISFIQCYARFKGFPGQYISEQQEIEDILNMHEAFLGNGYVLTTKKQKIPYDLTQFRTRKFANFYDSLGELDELTPEIFKNKASEFIQANSSFKSNDTITSIMYFHFKGEFGLFTTHMAPVFAATNQFAELSLPAISTVPTTDKKIIRLRQIVEEYQRDLTNLEEEERTTYPDRKPEAIIKRRDALETIVAFANQHEKLSPLMISVIRNAVDEIERNEPTWFEKSRCEQILDICTLGFSLFLRWCFTSQQNSARERLHQVAKGEIPEDENPEDGSPDKKDAPGN